jgi:quercetin dioxygenase-like cupin family protein
VSDATVVDLETLRLSERAIRFEGRDHGSTVSFFSVAYRRGVGASLHRHPYEETFVVLEGEGVFHVDGEDVHAHAGQVVIVPANAVHGFEGAGDGILRVVSIHPSDHVVQEDLA